MVSLASDPYQKTYPTSKETTENVTVDGFLVGTFFLNRVLVLYLDPISYICAKHRSFDSLNLIEN